jgi:peptidoglycan hydrolase CwlO-like protein
MATQKIKDTYSDDVRLALLEQSINNINSTLVRFEKRFDQIDAKIDKLDTKIDTNQKWCIRLISGLYLLLSSAFITILIKFVH